MTTPLTIWVITEGIAGTENQCLGIAEALGGKITIKRIKLRPFWRIFSPWVSFGEGPCMLAAGSDTITPPWPDVVVAGGRKAIGIARYIRKASAGRTVVAVVQSPYVCPSTFDLVAVPKHDGLHATHGTVIETDGAPNRITTEKLVQAREKWDVLLSPLPGPRVAVLVGGNSKTHRLGTAQMTDLITHLKTLHRRDQASLMITLSRRTPPDLAEHLKRELAGAGVSIWDGTGDNPYFGFLAWADYIVCTSDSASMLSDAATTGKPVFLYRLPGGSAKFDRLYAHLTARGVVRELGAPLQSWTYEPFNDAARVAGAIRDLLEQRRKGNSHHHA